MAEARQRHDWAMTSSLLALLANCHRDPKKSRPLKPADFDPFSRGQNSSERIPADVGVLKDVFIKKKAEQGGSDEG